jgi:LacI family transcriptional regulator
MMTTIQDVAKRAGVAPMTVSRVINNSGYASTDVRERVLAAISDLGYVPNTLARSLRIRRTHTIALILTDITNPFFTTIARGVEDAANAAGYTVIFGNTDESEEKEARYLDMIQQKRVDGILLVPAGGSEQPVENIRQVGTPLVVIDRRIPGEKVDVVRCDTEAGAYQLTRMLLDLGHHQIAMLTGPATVSTAEDRAAGFRRAMQEAGETAPLVLYGSFTQDSGYANARKALVMPIRCTAMIAANNFIAIGALKAIRAAELEVPEDVAMMGFDDLPSAMVIEPFLTVAVQPAYEMGHRAAELLISRLNGDEISPPQEILLPLDLVIRQSSGIALG